MNIKEGEKLVKTARAAINSTKINFEIKEKKGVFVTLYNYPKKELRGCIGFIEPVFGLSEGTYRAAREAAFNDPRFVPLDVSEKYIIEVSVLTKPKLLKGDYLKQIKIGKDGLIIEKNYSSGLLLPKVAVEYKFDVKKFLENTCIKAGLNKDDWKENCKLYIFQTEVFSEESPNGKVRKIL